MQFIPYNEAKTLLELGYKAETNYNPGEASYTPYSFWIEQEGKEPRLSSLTRPARELLFPAPTLTPAPTWRQAFRWFREQHKLDSYARQFTWLEHSDFGKFYFRIEQMEQVDKDEDLKDFSAFKDSYEEAELACLHKLIEIIKEKTKQA